MFSCTEKNNLIGLNSNSYGKRIRIFWLNSSISEIIRILIDNYSGKNKNSSKFYQKYCINQNSDYLN